MAKRKASAENDATRGAAGDLHRRAEETVPRERVVESELSPLDLLQLVDELRAHQSQLEMENKELRRTQQELDASRDRYLDLHERAPVGYLVLSETALILDANVTAANLLGVAREEMVSKPLSRFVAREDWGVLDSHLKRTFGTEVRQSCELCLVKADSTVFYAWLESVIVEDSHVLAPRPDTEGKKCRTMLHDVTQRRQAEQARLQLAAIVESSDDAIISETLDGTITSWNVGAERIYGYSAAEVKGCLISLLVPPQVLDEVPVMLDRIRQGERIEHFETVRTRKDGAQIDVSLTLSPIKDESGGIAGASVIARDITALKQAERLLRTAHDELEKRVQDRTRELREANQEIRAMSRSERRQRLLAEALVQATLAINTSLDQDQVLDCILEQTQRVIPCRAVAVLLIRNEVAYVARYRGFEDPPEAVNCGQAGLTVDAVPFLRTMSTSGQLVLVADALNESAWRHSPGFEWAESCAAVPMQGREGTIGFLNVFSDQPDAFSSESIGFLHAFAAHAVLAIQNAELYAAALRARQAAEALSSASLALTQTLDLDVVLDTLLDYLYRLVPYDSASVILSQDQTHLVVRAARGYEGRIDRQEILASAIDAHASPLIRALFNTQESILIPDTAAHPNWEHPVGKAHVRNWLGVPLVAERRVIGICGLDKTEPAFFTPQHIELATALVRQAAVAVQNAGLFEQVRTGRERLQSLSQRLVELQEAERRYIARELHDEAGQALTSLMVGLRLLEREATQPEAVVTGVAELITTVETVLEDLHRLAMALRPASLDHLGLVAALRQYVEVISHRQGLVVQFESVGFDRRLPVNLETALYRIVQEALTNVIRHAKATRVDVVLHQIGDRLRVIVEDNGVGFDTHGVLHSERLGLVGIRERAEMMGGWLVLESTVGGGTTLLVEVPYAITDTHRG